MKSTQSLLIALILLFSIKAQAFSVKIHMFYANQIIENLDKNMEVKRDRNNKIISIERPENSYLNLIAPNGSSLYRVKIDEDDAQTIIENPLYFRGGAIGPDNTAFSGLTDPSHSPHFKPFYQCLALYQNAKRQYSKNPSKSTAQELAYANGCFLHGITDNVAHHIVNYFSNQTFTLNPIKGLVFESGKLKLKHNHNHGTNMINVIHHIMTETKFEKAYATEFPDKFHSKTNVSPFQHKIAKNLFEKTYLNPATSNGQYVYRKIIDPINTKIKNAISNMDQSGKSEYSMAYLKRKIKIYASVINQAAPFEKVLMLKVMIKDMNTLMEEFLTRGKLKVKECLPKNIVKKAVVEETSIWGALKSFVKEETDALINNAEEYVNKNLNPFCKANLYLYEATGDNNFKSPAWKLIETRKKLLGQLSQEYLATLDKLSNHLATKGDITKTTKEDINAILAPMRNKINEITNFPVELLTPKMRKLIGDIKIIKKMIDGITEMLHQVLNDVFLNTFTELMALIQKEIAKKKEAALQLLFGENLKLVREMKEKVKESLKEATQTQIARALIQGQMKKIEDTDSDGLSIISQLPTSVAHMNAYNSIVGVLANHNAVVEDKDRNLRIDEDFNFKAPVSFDASYQLEYNQMSLCPEMKEIFYPCGTRADEMLQPGGYKVCSKFHIGTNSQAGQPPIECFENTDVEYSKDPSVRNCTPKTVEEVNSAMKGSEIGSYSLSFPPQYLPGRMQPECRGNYDIILEKI